MNVFARHHDQELDVMCIWARRIIFDKSVDKQSRTQGQAYVELCGSISHAQCAQQYKLLLEGSDVIE